MLKIYLVSVLPVQPLSFSFSTSAFQFQHLCLLVSALSLFYFSHSAPPFSFSFFFLFFFFQQKRVALFSPNVFSFSAQNIFSFSCQLLRPKKNLPLVLFIQDPIFFLAASCLFYLNKSSFSSNLQ